MGRLAAAQSPPAPAPITTASVLITSFTFPGLRRAVDRAVLDLDHCIIIRLAVQIISCDKGLDNGFSAAQRSGGENEVRVSEKAAESAKHVLGNAN